jgi:hypothetical protein
MEKENLEDLEDLEDLENLEVPEETKYIIIYINNNNIYLI